MVAGDGAGGCPPPPSPFGLRVGGGGRGGRRGGRRGGGGRGGGRCRRLRRFRRVGRDGLFGRLAGSLLLGCGAVGGFRRLIERGGEGGGGDDRGEGGTEQ